MTDDINPYASPDSVPLEPLRHHSSGQVRDILRDAWTLFTEHFLTILVVMTVVWLPLDLVSSYMDYHVFGPENFKSSMRLSMLLDTLIGILGTAAVIAVGVTASTTGHPTPGGSLVIAIRSWLRLLLTRIITGFMILAGLLFLIFPGIYLAIRMSLTDSIVVAERLAGASAIQRSFELTQGRFWYMTKLSLIVVAFLLILSFTLGFLYELLLVDNWIVNALSDILVNFLMAYATLCFYCAYRTLAATMDPVVPDNPQAT